MKKRSGYIFVQALVVVACLAALMAMLVADQRATLQGIQTRLRERRAEVAADAAVARALAVLQAATPNLVKQTDEWALQGTGGSDEFDFSNGSAHFRMQIVDEGSFLNINTATMAQLQFLPLSQTRIDSLLDWREAGTQPRLDGAKDEYYNALTQPYNTKLGPLTTLNELLLVKDWKGATLYQPPSTGASQTTSLQIPLDKNNQMLPLAALLTVDSGAPNTQADGTARINLGARLGNVNTLTNLGIDRNLALQLLGGAPYTSFAAMSRTPGMNPAAMQILLNAVTFSTATRTQGKINVNTATEPVLETIPNVTSDIAKAIVAQQAAGFSTLGDLATISGIQPNDLAALADNVTIGSDTWLVRAYGESSGVGVALEVVVGLRNGQMQVINWDRLSTTKIPTWWNWDAQPGQTLDAGDEQ